LRKFVLLSKSEKTLMILNSK